MASRQRGLQSLSLPAGFRAISEQQRPGMRVTGPLLCGPAPPQGQRREAQRKIYVGLCLGYFPAVLRSTGGFRFGELHNLVRGRIVNRLNNKRH